MFQVQHLCETSARCALQDAWCVPVLYVLPCREDTRLAAAQVLFFCLVGASAARPHGRQQAKFWVQCPFPLICRRPDRLQRFGACKPTALAFTWRCAQASESSTAGSAL